MLLLPKQKWIARWAALGIATVIAGVSIAVFFAYNRAAPGFQFAIQTEWFQLLGSSWHIGVDGISATMVLLTGILTPLAVLVSFEIEDRVNTHMALILFFATGLFGVFVAMDLMVFFLFYELTLVPMYFIIDQWGGPNRKYASTKFFIYSMGGSLGMLLATQLIGFTAGTFDIQTLTNTSGTVDAVGAPRTGCSWAFRSRRSRGWRSSASSSPSALRCRSGPSTPGCRTRTRKRRRRGRCCWRA